MNNEDAIDKQIKQLIEKKEDEINAFKKLLEGLEAETPDINKTKQKRSKKK